MRIIGLFTLLLLSISSFAKNPPVTIVYVNKTASGANNGTSWIDAYAKLQDALAATSAGEIWVAKGTYYPDEGAGNANNNYGVSFQLKNNVGLYGGFAGTETDRSKRVWNTNVTVLSGDLKQDDGAAFANNTGNAIHVVTADDINSTAVLDGFTITGGNAFASDGADGLGGGIRLSSSSPLIANCLITGNNSNLNGGGLYAYLGSPTLLNCSFLGNKAANGGGVYNTNTVSTVVNCSFSKNAASEDGGAFYNRQSYTNLTNCTFWSNTAVHWGGAFYNYYISSSTMVNCSLSGNTASKGGGITNESDSEVTFTNCILWGNTNLEIHTTAESNEKIYNTIVKGGYPNTGALDKDPKFADAANGDLHVTSCSPAIDAGTESGAPANDLDGAPRPSLAGYDLGAYEFQGSATPVVIYVNAAAASGGNGTSWITAFAKLQDALSTASSCHTAYQVWVAKGTYYPDEGAGKIDNDRSATFSLKNNIALYGGFAGSESGLSQRDWKTNVAILSGDLKQDDAAGFANNSDNSYNVFRNVSIDKTAILDGFVVTAGNMDDGEDIGGFGGGMNNYQASPTISNCTFQGNYALVGGGMSNDNSSPRLTNCTFSGNGTYYRGGGMNNYQSSPTLTACTFQENATTGFGGGIHCEAASLPSVMGCVFSGNTANYGAAAATSSSSPAFTNCKFWGNTAASHGGGLFVYNPSAPTLINCSFSGNKAADRGAGVYSSNASPVLMNCILWGNDGKEIYNGNNSNPTITYSLIQGGYSGEGNLDGDPLFVNVAMGDLYLKACSPAINAGSNDAVPTEETKDLDGNTRIVHTSVDIGAYEYAGTLYNLYTDADSDGYGDAAAASKAFFCSTQPGYAANNTDCNDGDKTIGAGIVWYKDADDDGYSDGTQLTQCTQPDGYKAAADLNATTIDCNDNNAMRSPATVWVLDADGDGYYGPQRTQCTSPGAGYSIKTTQQGGDCADSDPTTNPGVAEVCGNGKDDNCNGATDEKTCYACQNGTSLTTTAVTCTGATFNWASLPNPVQWQVQYKTTSTGSKWKDVLLTGDKRSVSVTNLKGGQSYIWHIRAKCGKSWTAYSNSIGFKTTSCPGALMTTSAKAIEQDATEAAPNALSVYPNPGNGQFTLQLTSHKGKKADVVLFNASGVVVERRSIVLSGTGQRLYFDLRSKASGFYLVKVTSDDRIQTTKVIVQK